MNAPSKFNDPFDSILEIDENDKAKSLNLIINYFTFKILCDFVENPDLYLKEATDRLLINTIKGEVALYSKLIKKQKTYDHLPFFDTIIREISSLNEELKIAIESAKMNKLKPNDYIEYILTKMAGNKLTENMLEEIMPWSKKLPKTLYRDKKA